MNALVGTRSTEKACLFLENQSRFVGCEPDGGCVKNFMAGLVQVYAFQLLNDKSDLKSGEELTEAECAY